MESEFPSWSCPTDVYKHVWYIPLLSVQWINSWWWTEELSETRRVSRQNKFVKLVHLVGFIIKKFVTMNGHTNVKFVIRLLWADIVRGAKIHSCLCAQYADSALPRQSIQVWVEIFKNSRTTVTHAERSGGRQQQPITRRRKKLVIILAARKVTTEEIALQLGISLVRLILSAWLSWVPQSFRNVGAQICDRRTKAPTPAHLLEALGAVQPWRA